ncbi:MAG: response regulator receiver and domain protein [Frankiales bacterium]|jgi:GAF domain-containing protein|nr:response regulator receiver and domain protein [Frankiales bacterium]
MGANEDFDGARMFARIARELAEQTDLQSTGERVVTLAKTLIGCDSVAKWALSRQGTITLRAATDPVLAEVYGEIIAETKEGPAWECLRGRSTVLMRDLRMERRWPRWREAAMKSAAPYLSAVGYSLDVRGESMGALVLASHKPDYFSDDLVEMGAIFAEHAAISLAAATSDEKGDNLQVALASNRRIGISIGILMSSYRCTEEQAFDMLRAVSQSHHHKLREVAEDVILTGALPELPARLVQAG